MPFVQAKCENCGGILQTDPSKKAAICPYCGTPYVVQDAINNYITNIGNLHADVVNVNDDTSAKARLEAADAFMKLRKYGDARKAFAEVCALTPQNHLGWWGQIRAITKEFTKDIEKKTALEEIFSLYESAQIFIPEAEKRIFDQKFQTYYRPLHERNTCRRNTLETQITQYNQKLSELQRQIDSLTSKDYRSMDSMPNFYAIVILIIVCLGFIRIVMTKTADIIALLLTICPIIPWITYELILRPINNTIVHTREKRDTAEWSQLSQEFKHISHLKANAVSSLNRLL